jgi:penicillin-binding protein 2
MTHSRSDRLKTARLFGRRTAVLGAIKLALLGSLVGRMYYLQVTESPKYRVLSDDNRISVRPLVPPRGEIFDRFGTRIATNRPYYSVIINPEQASSVPRTLDAAGRIILIHDEDRERVTRVIRQQPLFVPVVIREDLSWDELARIEVNAVDLPGISAAASRRRYYPYGPVVAHVLGYVALPSEAEATQAPLVRSPDFRNGKMGIERLYDSAVQGKAGHVEMEVNAHGREVRELSRTAPVGGVDLMTTLDIGLQRFLANRLGAELSAAAVVMDVRNGEILAMTSTPTFDPNLFVNGIGSDDWDMLSRNEYKPLMNKAISGQYTPGSTFKMMTALAALEAGVVRPEKTFFCPGFLKLGDATFHCWKRSGHGHVDMFEAIKQSCDVYFYNVAMAAGIDAIARMANRFGLGDRSGLGLVGEHPGLIPTGAWKVAQFGEPWQMGETLIAGIGQGYVTATVLQLAVMTARLVNHGIPVTPTLLRNANSVDYVADDPVSNNNSLSIDPRWLELMKAAMVDAVKDPKGTAYKARIFESGKEMGGKTGTAQVRRITMAQRRKGLPKAADLPWAERDHALFVGFAPVEQPLYSMAVIVEHGGGGASTAAPIARDVLLEAQRRNSAMDGIRSTAGKSQSTGSVEG